MHQIKKHNIVLKYTHNMHSNRILTKQHYNKIYEKQNNSVKRTYKNYVNKCLFKK